MERRNVFELRARGRSLAGLAAPFDRETRIGNVREVIRSGAFARTLASGDDVLALMDHDECAVLGRTRSGSLRLWEASDGLRFSLELPNTRAGQDALELAERGDLGGMSFGFLVPEEGARWDGDVRELIDVDLKEVSVVSAWPAYAGTSAEARARAPHLARARLFLETVR